jgi:uncharacterized membrane protein
MNHYGRRGMGSLTGGVAGGVTLLVLGVAFSLHALDVSWAWVVYPLGFGGLLPMAMGAAARAERDRTPRSEARGRDRTATGRTDTDASALESLRLRYARGEVDEGEFERRVERLLETQYSRDDGTHDYDDRTP